MRARPLQFLGVIVRAARVKRGLTQERAAKAAGVSRNQLARLEDGENVSVVFLQKVLQSLSIEITIGKGAKIATASSSSVVDALVGFAEDLAALAIRAREFAYDAALPPSQQDATAIAALVNTSSPAGDPSRLARALERLTNDVEAVGAAREVAATAKKPRRQQPRRKRQV